MIELGVASFGDINAPLSDESGAHAATIRNVVEQACAAEAAGLDFFSLGEHHRADFAISAPEIVLAVIGGRTRSIRLSTAANVLGADDPVRLYQRFASLNAATSGRAEMVVGRGWFAEAFRLFGIGLADYDSVFDEKLSLLVRLLCEREVTWSGRFRPALNAQRVFPPTGEACRPRLRVAIGSTPESVVRAVNHDLPIMVAVIGGEPERFRPLVELYRAGCAKLGRPAGDVGVHSSGFVAATDRLAREEFWPHYKQSRDSLGRERNWPALQRSTYDNEIERGSLFVGAPETVARKIVAAQAALGFSRFEMKCSAGSLAHESIVDSVDLFGRVVKPLVFEIMRARRVS